MPDGGAVTGSLATAACTAESSNLATSDAEVATVRIRALDALRRDAIVPAAAGFSSAARFNTRCELRDDCVGSSLNGSLTSSLLGLSVSGTAGLVSVPGKGGKSVDGVSVDGVVVVDGVDESPSRISFSRDSSTVGAGSSLVLFPRGGVRVLEHRAPQTGRTWCYPVA